MAVGLIILLCWVSLLSAFQVEFDFSAQEYSTTVKGNLIKVSLEDGVLNGKIGDVALPGRSYNIICHSRYRVSKIDYTYSKQLIARGVELPAITGDKPDHSDWKLKTQPYTGKKFPEPVQLTGESGWRGNHIVSLFVSPFLYYPANKTLYFLENIEVSLEFGTNPVELIDPLQTTKEGERFTKRLANSIFYNPEMFQFKASVVTTPSLLPLDYTLPPYEGQYPLDYVILTTESFADSLLELALLELQSGYRGIVVTLTEIDSVYSGADIEEEIRLFLQDAYHYWGIWAAIFCANYNLLPLRFGGAIDPIHRLEQFPTVFYYLALDGNWNFDRDNVFGESPEDDYLPDIIGGILPFTTPSQISPVIEKMRTYSHNPPADYIMRWLFAAASLTSPGTDYLGQHQKDTILTTVEIPESISVWKLYGNFEATGGDEGLNRTTFLEAINRGYIFINHIDHANVSVLGTAKKTGGGIVDINDIDNLVNQPNYPLLFTFSCHTAAPEYSNISKHWVLNPNGGGIGFIGTYRSVWTPQLYTDTYFVESLTEGYHTIGEIFTAFLSLITHDRFLLYDFNLDGNPLLPFWTKPPGSLLVNIPDSLPNTSSSLNVLVTDYSSEPVANARVTLVDNNNHQATQHTTRSGEVMLFLDNPESGYIYVLCSAHNFQSTRDSLYIYADETVPRWYISSFSATAEDDLIMPVDSGEFSITVSNNGGRSGVPQLEIISLSEEINVDDTLLILSEIPPLESVTYSPLTTFTTNHFEGRKYMEIEFILYDSLYTTTDTLGFFGYGPSLYLQGFHYYDTLAGNGNLTPDIMEEGELKVAILNYGDGVLPVSACCLVPMDTNVAMEDSLVELGRLNSGDTAIITFPVHFPRAFSDSTFNFTLTVTAEEVEYLDKELSLIVPHPPTNIRAKGDETMITLQWEPPVRGAEIEGYRIYRAESPDGPYEMVNSELITLATVYRDSPLPERTNYYYYVTAISTSHLESTPSDTIPAWTTLPSRIGWPTELSPGTLVFSSPAIGDINGDGTPEVFVASKEGLVHALTPDGVDFIDTNPAMRDVWFRMEENSFWANPIIADFNNDGIDELFLVTRGRENFAMMLDSVANYLPGWPRAVDGKVLASPTAYDFDHDSLLEIVVCTESKNVYIFQHNGAPFHTCDSTGLLLNLASDYDNSRTLYSSPAVADINNDDIPEIVVGGGSSSETEQGWLYAFQPSGTLLPGFPVAVDGWITSGIALGNVDTDYSTLEIAFGTQKDRVYCINAAGEIVWTYPEPFLFNPHASNPALIDVTGDGRCELIISGQFNFGVFTPEGSYLSGWPRPTPSSCWSEPAVVDIDNDNQLEILFPASQNYAIYGFEIDGTSLAGFPLLIDDEIYAAPTIAKFGSDSYSIIASSYASKLYLWETDIESLDTTIPVWAESRGGALRQGIATSLVRTSIDEHKNNIPNDFFMKTHPNPFNSRVTIEINPPYSTSGKLYAVDITGRTMDIISTGKYTPQNPKIIWQPRDLPSGLYFIIFKGGTFSQAKKALYLK